jgi:hypothetical protein
VVDEGTLSVELDHRQPLAIARLERRVAGDVDLLVREAEFALELRDLVAGAIAERAALPVEQGDRFQG